MAVAVRWSPKSDSSSQSFVLADGNDRSLTICNVTEYDGKVFGYESHPTYAKVPQFRNFDIAPFDQSLFAVGQWTGEVALLRIEDEIPLLTLPAKHQRLCNALAFNKNGLLAIGLERVRNVEGLNIWDVYHSLSAVPTGDSRTSKSNEPYRKLASSEAIADVKFFNGQPNALLAGVKGAGLRIYDLRESTGNAMLQFASNRVYNLAVDDCNENHVACSSTGKDSTVQIWDCRLGSNSVASAIDLVHQAPVLEYTNVFAEASSHGPCGVSQLRYSKARSGVLGALSNIGELKVFVTSSDHPSSISKDTDQHPAMDTASFEHNHIFTRSVHTIGLPSVNPQNTNVERERLISFDFVNMAGSKGGLCIITLRNNGDINVLDAFGAPSPFALSSTNSLMVARTLPSSVAQASASTREPKCEIRQAEKLVSGRSDLPLDGAMETLDIGKKLHKTNAIPHHEHLAAQAFLPARGKGLFELDVSLQGNKTNIETTLGMIDTPKQRAKLGYGLNAETNLGLVKAHKKLHVLWAWIESKAVSICLEPTLTQVDAQARATDRSMAARGLDLGYLGVHSIWKSQASE